MSNKRVNKAYVRYHGSGRVIPGSLILNRFKPKVGNWSETPAYLCCNGTELLFTPESFPIVNPRVNFYCNNVLIDDPVASGLTADNMASLVEILNNESGTAAFGHYAIQSNANYPNENIKLTVPDAVKQQYCATGTLSFTITPD